MKKSIPALPVESIEVAIGFYKTELGFSVTYHDEGFAKLVRDEVEIHLREAFDNMWKEKGSSLAAQPICSGAESFLAGTASCRIEIEGIDQLFDECKEQEVIYSPDTVITKQPWGYREFPALDLHGNLLTFHEKVLIF